MLQMYLNNQQPHEISLSSLITILSTHHYTIDFFSITHVVPSHITIPITIPILIMLNDTNGYYLYTLYIITDESNYDILSHSIPGTTHTFLGSSKWPSLYIEQNI